MAIALPLLLVVAIGAIDFARAFRAHETLERTAQDVVRYASVRSQDSDAPASLADITAFVHDRAEGLDPERLTVETTYTPANTAGSKVYIAISYDFTPVVPVIPEGARTLVGSSSMRVAY